MAAQEEPKLEFSYLTVIFDTASDSDEPLVKALRRFEQVAEPVVREFKTTPEFMVRDPAGPALDVGILAYVGGNDIVLRRRSTGGVFSDIGGEHIEGWSLSLNRTRNGDIDLGFRTVGPTVELLDALTALIERVPLLRTHSMYKWGGVAQRQVDGDEGARKLALTWINDRRKELENS